jgi:hypothetical protein
MVRDNLRNYLPMDLGVISLKLIYVGDKPDPRNLPPFIKKEDIIENLKEIDFLNCDMRKSRFFYSDKSSKCYELERLFPATYKNPMYNLLMTANDKAVKLRYDKSSKVLEEYSTRWSMSTFVPKSVDGRIVFEKNDRVVVVDSPEEWVYTFMREKADEQR